MVAGGAENGGVDAVGGGFRAKDEDCRPLPSHIAAGVPVEWAADEVGGKDAGPQHHEGAFGLEDELHAADQGEIKFPGPYALAGPVQGDKPGGADGIDGKGLAFEAEKMGDPS